MDLTANTIFIRDTEEVLEVPPEGDEEEGDEEEGYLTLVLTPLEVIMHNFR